MSLRRALQSSRSAHPPEGGGAPAAFEAKPWSRRGWPREQLRAHWPHLTIQQVELLKEVFQLFDTEDKGYFTKDDLYFVMEAMGGSPTPQELDAVMYELDSNGDSVVDFPEFLTKFLTATDERELLSVFHQLAIQEGDGNDDRVLTLTAVERSFQYVGERLTDEDRKYLEIIFRGADKDGNGRLDIKEFTAYLEKMDDELFMGQAGALGSLLAAANTSGGAAAAKSLRRGGGGSAGPGGVSRHRSGMEDGELGGGAPDGGGGSAAADPETPTAMLTNGQLLAMATRALSSRGAAAGVMFGGGGSGLADDLESVSSNQGGLRHSFLSKLTRARHHRRSSVNSSTIAAIAEQLASLGVAGGGGGGSRAVRVGSMGSTACLAAASPLHPEASEGLRSASSVRTAGMHGGGGAGAGAALMAAGAAAQPPGGVAPHFIVETSGVSALRLVSSTGQMPGFLGFPEEPQGRRGPASTAPVALSRGGSFGDGGGQGPAGPDGELAAGVGRGSQHQYQHQHSGRPPGGGNAADGGSAQAPSEWHQPPQPPHPRKHTHRHPHRSPNQQQAQSPMFGQMRSRSMPAPAAAAPVGLPPSGLAPLVIPSSLPDSEEPFSGSGSPLSPFSPTPGSVAAAIAAAAAAGGGGSGGSPVTQERGSSGMHAGYSGRTLVSGLHSPAASWQKSSVIQEAPEEGDSSYGGVGAASALATAPLGPQWGMAAHRLDLPSGRTSAPTRFGRLSSFPTRLPQPLDLTAGGGGVGGGGGGGDVTDGRSSAGAKLGGGSGGSGGGAAPPPPRPIRLGSGGEGRLSHRVGGLMAAVFNRPRSLGHGAATAAAAAAAAATAAAQQDATAEAPPAHSGIPAAQAGARPSPSPAQLPLPPPASAGQSGGGESNGRPSAISPASSAPTRTQSSWGFAASARAAIGWLRRGSSLSRNQAATGGSGGGNSSGGAGAAEHANQGAPLPLPAAAAGAAARAGPGEPPWRLTVQVPDTESPGSSKPTSPADADVSPGPSAGTSSLMSPLGPSGYFASPFTSPAAAAATAAIAGGLTSPPPALLLGSFAAAGLASPEAAGPPTPGSTKVTPPQAAPLGPGQPPPRSPRAAHSAAPPQPYLRPPSDFPYSRASAPGASPWLAQHPQNPQRDQHPSTPGLQPSEPGVATASPPLPAATPPAWLPRPPRPAPQVPPIVVSVSPRLGGPSALGAVAPGARSLNRSGSVGGSSRLAVSSARDSPPVVAPALNMQRQQSLQLQPPPLGPQHPPSPLAQQLPQPPPQHLLSLKNLPSQHALYLHSTAPQQPFRGGQPPPQEPELTAQPHRLSCTGRPHEAPHHNTRQSPPQPQQPQQRPGDWAPRSPYSGLNNPHYHNHQQQAQQQHLRSRPSSASSSIGSAAGSVGGVPSAARAAAFAAGAATAPAPGSPWGAVWAAAAALQNGGGGSPPASEGGVSGEGPPRRLGQPPRGGGAQTMDQGVGHPLLLQQPVVSSGFRKEPSEPAAGSPLSLGQHDGQQPGQQQQQGQGRQVQQQALIRQQDEQKLGH